MHVERVTELVLGDLLRCNATGYVLLNAERVIPNNLPAKILSPLGASSGYKLYRKEDLGDKKEKIDKVGNGLWQISCLFFWKERIRCKQRTIGRTKNNSIAYGYRKNVSQYLLTYLEKHEKILKMLLSFLFHSCLKTPVGYSLY